MKYNFKLTFNEEDANNIQEYADKINNNLNTDYKLENNPCITLIKFEIGKELTQEYREEISSKFEEIEIGFSGLKLLPSKDGGTWIEISVLQSEELRKLIKDFYNLFPDIKILNPIGDNLRLHLTICKLNNQKKININDLDYDLLRSKIKVKPRLFIAGEVF